MPASDAAPAARAEPAVVMSLGLAGAMSAWGASLPTASWLPAMAVCAIALTSLLLGSWVALGSRALAVVAAGGVLALLEPSQAPVTLIWVLTACATYPFVLPRLAGMALTVAGITALATPLVVQAARGAGSDPARSLLWDLQPMVNASTFSLIGGIAVVIALGGHTAAARRTLHAATTLARRHGADARRSTAQLARATSTDPLTTLPNRAALETMAAKAIARVDAVGGQVALLLLEIDRFAGIGDSFGPVVADDVIYQIGRRLRAARPAEDAVARIGPHHFAVLVEGVGREGCTGMARRLSALVEEPVRCADRQLSITCSTGIAVASPGLDTADELIRAATEAGHAVQRGGGRVRWATFDQAMRAHAVSQAALELELRDALRTGRIQAAYQPVLGIGDDARAGRVVAVETLARWTRPDGTAVPPQRFLPMAEDLGLGVTLGLQVLDHALVAISGWRTAGLDIPQVWVNLSASQLEDPEFAHMVSARLAARDLQPSSLLVEVSAAELVESEQTASTLGMLRSLGIEVAMDHFGRTGASLTALRELPATTVKLDHQLAADLSRRHAIPRAVVAMCRELGMRTVATGIDTHAQLEGARDVGVGAVQGHLIGRPMAADDVAAALDLHTTVPR